MKLTVVGCSGSFPGPDSPASCYLVEHDDTRILLDMGNGSLGTLQRYADIYEIDAVVLSHLHVDHFIDLCSFYVALRYHPELTPSTLPVYGPADTADRLVAAYGMSPGTDMTAELDVRHIADRFTIGPFTIESRPMRHPIEARAVRVTAGGRSLTYSGDTGPTPDLAEFARGTDLALFEASFVADRQNPADLHLTGEQAAQLASKADAGQLVLTHLVPWNDSERVLAEATPVFPEARLASQGLVIEL